MKELYAISGISKQAFHQHRQRRANQRDRTDLYVQMIEQARVWHPVIGLEKIYYLFEPEGIGRDSFIQIGTMAGYAQEKAPRTSWKGPGPAYYPNLLEGKSLNGYNQVWATDITYYRIGSKYYYISMILDLYSRRILVASVADSLHAFHSLALLKKAIRVRGIGPDHGLIHHSDRGVQYSSNGYVGLLKKKHIGISMCRSVFENASMERLNGIVKNDYLVHWKPSSFKRLQTLLKKAVKHYNHCPHGKLGMKSPLQYEQQIDNTPIQLRPQTSVFTFNKTKKENLDQLQLFDPNQFILQPKRST